MRRMLIGSFFNKQTTTATATRMLPNKKHIEQNTSAVLTVHDYFLGVLKGAETQKTQTLWVSWKLRPEKLGKKSKP